MPWGSSWTSTPPGPFVAREAVQRKLRSLHLGDGEVAPVGAVQPGVDAHDAAARPARVQPRGVAGHHEVDAGQRLGEGRVVAALGERLAIGPQEAVLGAPVRLRLGFGLARAQAPGAVRGRALRSGRARARRRAAWGRGFIGRGSRSAMACVGCACVGVLAPMARAPAPRASRAGGLRRCGPSGRRGQRCGCCPRRRRGVRSVMPGLSDRACHHERHVPVFRRPAPRCTARAPCSGRALSAPARRAPGDARWCPRLRASARSSRLPPTSPTTTSASPARQALSSGSIASSPASVLRGNVASSSRRALPRPASSHLRSIASSRCGSSTASSGDRRAVHSACVATISWYDDIVRTVVPSLAMRSPCSTGSERPPRTHPPRRLDRLRPEHRDCSDAASPGCGRLVHVDLDLERSSVHLRAHACPFSCVFARKPGFGGRLAAAPSLGARRSCEVPRGSN